MLIFGLNPVFTVPEWSVFHTCSDWAPLLRPLIIILQLRVFQIAIEQQMKTLSRLSYLLSQLIPTPGSLLLSRQHWEWQVENGIPPSAPSFYWIFPLPLSFDCICAQGLRIVLLHASSQVTEMRAKSKQERQGESKRRGTGDRLTCW